MSPVEMRGRPAIAGNRVSREINSPLAVAGMVAAGAVEIAGVARIAAAAAEVARIAAAGKRADEEFL